VYLKQLEILGFKTFAEKTQIVFSPGVTCIVGPNGSGKCVTGDTLVTLTDGRDVPIQELVDAALNAGRYTETLDDGVIAHDNPDGIEILSLNPSTLCLEPRPVRAFVRRKAPPYLLRIRTRAGREVTATPYHPLFTLEEGHLRALRADELREGIRLAVPRRLPMRANTPEVALDPFEVLQRFEAEDNLYIGHSEALRDWAGSVRSKFGTFETWRRTARVEPMPWKGFRDGQSVGTTALTRLARTAGSAPPLDGGLRGVSSKHGMRLPLTFTPDLARFLGLLVAEGRSTSGNQARFVNADPEVCNEFERLSQALFGLSVYRKHYKEGLETCLISSHALCRTLHRLFDFPVNSRSADKEVPSQLFSSPAEVQWAFLSGLFEGDAHIRVKKQGSTTQAYVEYVSASRKLADQVVALLLRLGIFATLHPGERYAANTAEKRRRIYYRVIVYGAEQLRYLATHLSFIGGKRAGLQALCDLPPARNPNHDLIPGVTPLVREAVRQAGVGIKRSRAGRPKLACYAEGRCEASRSGLLEVVAQIEELAVAPEAARDTLDHLSTLATSDVYWDEIVSIERVVSSEEWVYDLSVSGTHNFVAGNVVVHNSNISDAVLWVLGEINVRSLRGSTSQDVIFAGNDRRRPLGMAEVSLTIDNSTRIVPLDFTEITVTRRLYRSGESEYFINKVACRLKDIYELFLDTGVGRDAYSMINQGEIDQILSVRAEDRRAIFEEAAGIKKYRVRKREAERKLEQTQHNLLRVHDIIAEIEAQLGPLQRQATAAKRYWELAARLGKLEDAWYGTRLKRLQSERESLAGLVQELNAERQRLEEELNQSQEAEKTANDALQRLDARTEQLRREETAALQQGAAAQAERARAEERAGEVGRRLRALERELEDLAERIQDQVQRSEAIAREEADLKREVDALRAALGKAQVTAQERRQAHETASQELERRRQAWLARARRIAELEARMQSLETRVKSLEGERARAAEALEDGEAELERLRLERESFLKAAAGEKDRGQAHAAELEKLKEAGRLFELALSQARSTSERAAAAHNSHQARLQALSELSERGEGAATGAKRVLDAARRRQLSGSWSLLVDGLRAPEGLEKAVEAALGVYGDALLCDSHEDALAALEWLRGQKVTALILPGLPPPGEAALSVERWALSVEGEPVSVELKALSAEVSADAAGGGLPALGQAESWARFLLGRAVLCDSLEAAVQERAVIEAEASGAQRSTLNAQHSTPDLWVTRDGRWLARSGAMSGGPLGAEGSAAATLARRRELDRLREAAPGLEAALEEAREGTRRAEVEVRKAQGALREKQSEVEASRLENQANSREADRRSGDIQRSQGRVERLRADLARIERERREALEGLERARGEREREGSGDAGTRGRGDTGNTPVTGPAPDAGVDDPAVIEAQVEAGKLEAERRTAENAVSDRRVELAQAEQRLHGVIAASRRAADAGTFLDKQRADRLREQRSLVAEGEQRTLSLAALEQDAAAAQAEVERSRAELAALTEERAGFGTELKDARARSQDLGGRLRELMERCHRAQVELTAVDTQRKHLGEQWLESASERLIAAPEGHPGLRIADLRTPGPAEEAEGEVPDLTLERLIEVWDAADAEETLSGCSDPEGEINRLRRQIRALGAVNPDAVEQFAQARERYEFLTSQRADLEGAREQLEGAIQEIDAASRETFLAAFKEIAAAFDEMFKKLFGGGMTELRLTDPQDVLETGIDIIVQPPGKKQQNLLLLSGGERALTAAAMLFALLKVRPSPFCVMDEVDAPLDETNVGRFTHILREFSQRTQFIIVTHNRGTMEAANTLYGVTMQERGVSKVLSCSLDDPVVAQVEAEQRGGLAANERE
jgi:chromosome segregation protein